jgi:ABC-type multidrug transport system permease subunit
LKLSHVRVMTLMELKRIYNDKREPLLLIFGAIILCLVAGLIGDRRPQEINVTILVDHLEQPSIFEHQDTLQIISEIDKSTAFAVSRTNSLRDAMQLLNNSSTRAVIVMRENSTGLDSVQVTTDSTDYIVTHAILKELSPILKAHARQSTIEFLTTTGLSQQQANQVVNPFSIETKTNEWQEIKYFDLGATPLIVMIVLGICLLTAVTSVTAERTQGTIERIFSSPYRSSEVILSKILARSVFAVIVSIVIVFTLKLVFNIALANFPLALIITILVGINAVVFGLLVSCITYVELESVSLGITSWFLFMIMMGFTWPIESMHPIFQFIASSTPYLYAVHAIRHVSLVGWGLSQAWLDLVILCGFILAGTLIAMLLLKRKIR